MESKIFITSDTFFGRNQIIDLANRPFGDVSEMDNILIQNWNQVVSENDTVYHLGNFAWDPTVCDDVLRSLNGQKKIMIGDYDMALIETAKYHDNVEIITDQIYQLHDKRIVLSHWPLEIWSGKNNGVFHFHGHTFNSMKTDLKKMNRVNACVDMWNYRPQTVDEMFDLFEEFKEKTE